MKALEVRYFLGNKGKLMHLGLKVKRGLTGEKDGEKGRGGIRHI